jgi:hypothetical protein
MWQVAVHVDIDKYFLTLYVYMFSLQGIYTSSSNRVSRSGYYKTMFDTVDLPYNKIYNNCDNTLCYTYSKNFIYKPHSAYGIVGTSAASYLARRNRL